MEFISAELDQYVCKHTENEPKLLNQLNRKTHVEVLKPRMLSGHFQGRALSLFSHMIKPKRILEIGTYTGYSALCLAEGLLPEGKLYTIDVNEELEDFANDFFDKSPYKNQIIQLIGDAKEIIPTIEEEFDIVFIDADKKSYSDYYDMIFHKIKVGGYIMADNVLWSGKVIEDYERTDRDTQKLIEFNTKVQNDERVENVLFPIRDGIMIARKVSD